MLSARCCVLITLLLPLVGSVSCEEEELPILPSTTIQFRRLFHFTHECNDRRPWSNRDCQRSNFLAASQVLWNGNSRVTTFQSATSLSAQITASDLANTRDGEYLCHDPAPGGGVSNPSSFAIQCIAYESGKQSL